MSMRIGPRRCSECGDDYYHKRSCSQHPDRPENRPISEKLLELSAADLSPKDRIDRLFVLVIALAKQVEGNE